MTAAISSSIFTRLLHHHTYRVLPVAIALVLAVPGCRDRRPPVSARVAAPAATAEPAEQAASARSIGPDLVVVVVLDQLSAATLSRYLPELDEDGALRTAARRGVYHRRVRHAYPNTFTAPGHATLHTGAEPRRSCVVTNSVWDYAREQAVASVDDGLHPVHGHGSAFAGPGRLCAPTVGDALREQRPGARVVSLSMKDRSAVLPGGKSADLAIWYDAKIPGFTTSSYYADSLPPWLAAWQSEATLQRMRKVWEPLNPVRLEELLGPDDGPGEGNWKKYGVVFPHAPEQSEAPDKVLLASPHSSEVLIDLAAAAVEELRLGEDEIPDLLALSISGTDYVGHAFGPDSWEYLDNLIRVDRALGAFLRKLSQKHEIAVLFSSDHGHAALPERTNGGRIISADFAAEVEAMLDRRLGDGAWIQHFKPPFLYLTDEVRKDHIKRSHAVAAALTYLSQRDGIEWVYDSRDATSWADSADPVRREIALGLTDVPDGDIVVYLSEDWVHQAFDLTDSGTSHGTAWEYDREVPVLFWGPGVEPATFDTVGDTRQVAPTVSALLGIAPPDRALAPGLGGVQERVAGSRRAGGKRAKSAR